MATAEQDGAGPAHADLTVRLDLGQHDLAGQLIVAEQPQRIFHGWLGLLSVLDQALEALERSRVSD